MNFDESAWDGSASNWETAEAYCRDCLIDINPAGQEKSKDNCKLPYRKPGGAVNKNALRAMGTGARGLPAVDAPASAKRKAANWIIDKWPQAFDQPAPESIYRIAGKSRPTGNKAAFYKDRSGTLWFMGIYSNNFEDREGDILSWEAHQDFAQWVKTAGVKLPITLLHQPRYASSFHLAHVMAVERGLISPQEFSQNMEKLYKSVAIGRAETVIPLNGFMFVVGKVFDHKKNVVEKLSQTKIGWGMSHGFVRVRYDGNITDKYRTFEFTLAPADWVANNFTPIGFSEGKIMADMKQLSEEDRTLIETLLNGDPDALEEGTEEARKILSRLLGSKTLQEDEEIAEETEEEEAEPTEYEALRAKMFADLHVEDLQSTLKTVGETFDTLTERLGVLEEKLAQLEKSEDERIAEFITPDWSLGFATKTKNGSDDPELIERLKEDTEREIVEEKTKANASPLHLGLWSQLIPNSGG